MPSHRIERTTEDIRRELTAIFRELKDPRVSGAFLSIVRVEVTNDLSYSTPWTVGPDGRPVTNTKRYYPKDKVSFFGTGNGMRLGSGLWGIPPEEQIARFGVDVSYGGANPYVYVTQWAEKDPAVVWTKASGLFMPVLFNPYSLYVASVIETAGE